MFGHKAGSFTGATKDKNRLFEEANKGTIFLDEVGETKPTKIDSRIITASNRDFRKEIQEENFRSDLYYRLSVFEIYLPPLREGKEDIKLLANHFIKLFNNKMNKSSTAFSEKYITALENHQWERNIRQLKNVTERSMIMENSNELQLTSLPIEIQRNLSKNDSNDNELDSFTLTSAEKVQIQSVLEYTKGNKTIAVQLLNIALTNLYRK